MTDVPPPPEGGSYTPPPPPPPLPPVTTPPAANNDRQVMLVLSYCWLFGLIPLFVKKDDADVQWHAKNGLVMAVLVSGVNIGLSIAGRFSAVLGCLTCFVPCGLFIGYVIVSIIAIMKALKGERLRVPVLTDFAEKINI